MSGILDLLNSDLVKQIVSNISEKTGIDAAQASKIVSSSLPELMGAAQNNLTSGNNASGLINALTSGKHDGSILDNLGGFLKGNDFSDGNKIVNNLLGDKLDTVQSGISQKTGVDSGVISKILPMLAPIVMGYLGKQAKANNATSGADLSGLLGGLLGGGGITSMLDQNGDGKLDVSDAISAVTSNKGGTGSGVTSMLDQNGDGKLDAADAIAAVSGKKGGLGGLLGGLFGKK